jgi:hypothetical protein
MRVYLAVDAEQIEQLVAGGRLATEPYVAGSDDEDDEYAALEAAAEDGPAALAADVDDEAAGVTLDDVASFHLDLDGSGHLAWFATQEVDDVLRHLRSTPPSNPA